MIHYKGYIVNKKVLRGYWYEKLIAWHHDGYITSNDIFISSNNLEHITNSLENQIKKKILKAHNREEEKIEVFEENLIDCFNNNFHSSNLEHIAKINSEISNYGDATYILYELVKDKEGNLFAKELFSKVLFPIYNSQCEKYNYFIKYRREFGSDTWMRNNYYAEVNFDMEVSSLLKCEEIIVGHKVADLNDFNNYINQFRKTRFFRKKEEKEIEKYINEIKKLSQHNVFKEDFSLEKKEVKKEKVLEHQSLETSLMEQIEYNLINLKNINEELYLEYKKRYDNIINSYVSKESLALLLGEIEFSIIFKKRDASDIIEFINNLKQEYLNNFINNLDNITALDLKKLDKISELFLKIKNKYSFKDQRDVLNNLAFLYLMEVYENIDNLNEETLSNTYFSMYLKSIVMWIKYLDESDIIECNYLIELREDLNIKIVLDLINNISFKSKVIKR